MSGIDLLRDLLRIDTTNPPGDEDAAAEVLRSHLDKAGLQTALHKSPEGRTNLVARIPGPDTTSALVLLSHTDVVGVEEAHWSHDPFGGEIHDGAIWGRGALDMKGIAVMHAVAAATLARSAAEIRREVIVVAVADEEAGGKQGAAWLAKEQPESVGFGKSRPLPEVLGEGAFGLSGILPRPLMPISLGEKAAVWLNLHASGDPGHGAMPPAKQASLNLAKAIMDVAGFGKPRLHPIMREQFEILARNTSQPLAGALKVLTSSLGSSVVGLAHPVLPRAGRIGTLLADTVAVTQVSAGYKHNVVPGAATAALDCRLLPDTDANRFVDQMQRRLAKHSVSVEQVSRNGGPVSEKGPLYQALAAASSTLDPVPVVIPTLTPGITDIRYFRALGATGYGWAPLILTPEDLATVHGHNERVRISDFERAVEIMSQVVTLAST